MTSLLLLWHAATLLSGSSVGLLGTYMVGFRMPFLAVAISHAAMAGGVFAYVLGWPMGPVALAAALLCGGLVAWMTASASHTDMNTLTSILLSFTMALAFLGMGLNQGDMTPLLSLMWGSLLLVQISDVVVILITFAVLLLLMLLFGKELNALLFSRTVARASGIQERVVMMAFLVTASALVTVNLQIVGGLMMYSLLTNPAAAAYEIGRSPGAVRRWAILFGVISTVGGLWISYIFDLPTGACIVLVSCLVYAVAFITGRRGRFF